MNNKLPVSSLLIGRAKLIELLLVAIFIGFGISLAVSSISIINGFRPVIGIFIGVSICCISTIYISYKVFYKRKDKYLYKGFIILNELENRIVKVEGYQLSEQISEYFANAFSENMELQHIWNAFPLKLQDELKEPEPRSVDLIRESLEYFWLEKLSTHLMDCFRYPMETHKNISVLDRDQLPNVLLSNRFFELFSKPMKDRKAFAKIEQEFNSDNEWYDLQYNGAAYKKFLLVLPHNSSVIRKNKNEIEIKTNRFNLTIQVNFDGSNTITPDGFMEHYLSIQGFENYIANPVYEVDFKFFVKFKFRSLFTTMGWKDYNWIDSFLNSVDESVSKELFFKKINWSTVSTIIKCLKHK